MKKKISKKRIAFLAVNFFLLLAGLLCLLLMNGMKEKLVSQTEAERWQGESKQHFSQSSIFTAESTQLTLSDVNTIRTKVTAKLHEAALDIENEDILFNDAWSTTGWANVASSFGKGECSVIAVGGNYFDFHPIRLLNGSYIRPDDIMQDRVLLDEELSWLLFGSVDLQGMSITVNGENFYVAGVIRREDDFASRHAYTAGRGLYMSFDAYAAMNSEAGISCYEIVMAEPVKNFALSTLQSIFPGTHNEIISNTGRFTVPKLYGIVKNFAARTIQADGMKYPYWENAARYMEFCCAALLAAATLLLAVPVISALVFTVKLAIRGKQGLEEKVIPAAKENVEEFVRVQGRKRWEKKQGKHSK